MMNMFGKKWMFTFEGEKYDVIINQINMHEYTKLHLINQTWVLCTVANIFKLGSGKIQGGVLINDLGLILLSTTDGAICYVCYSNWAT